MSDQAWQSVENHDQSIRNMTKGVVMENLPNFFFRKTPTLVRSKISSTNMRLHFEFWSMLEMIALNGTFDWSAKRTNKSRCLAVILFEA